MSRIKKKRQRCIDILSPIFTHYELARLDSDDLIHHFTEAEKKWDVCVDCAVAVHHSGFSFVFVFDVCKEEVCFSF